MKHSFRKLRRKLFHEDEPAPSTTVQLENANSNGNTRDAVNNTGMPLSTNDSNVPQTQWDENAQPQDMWQVAYSKLTTSDQQILSSAQLSDDSSGRVTRTEQVLDQVIQTTKDQYEAYQKGGGFTIHKSRVEYIYLRDVAQKILNATLSFKDIISAVVAFDPTGHASSAWMIVSLGLTVREISLIIFEENYSQLMASYR
jgi:hypothetical protein